LGAADISGSATDSRYADYVSKYGEECWELDALEPSVIEQLIRAAVSEYLNDSKFQSRARKERGHRKEIGLIAKKWGKDLIKAAKAVKQ
jgi:hypothetical protein